MRFFNPIRAVFAPLATIFAILNLTPNVLGQGDEKTTLTVPSIIQIGEYDTKIGGLKAELYSGMKNKTVFAIAPVFAIESEKGKPKATQSNFDPNTVNVSFLAYPAGIRASAVEHLKMAAKDPAWLKFHFSGTADQITEAAVLRLPTAGVTITARGGSHSGPVLATGSIEVTGQNSALPDSITVGLTTKSADAAKKLLNGINTGDVFFIVDVAFNSLAEQSTWLRIQVADVRDILIRDNNDPTAAGEVAKKLGKDAIQVYSLDQITKSLASVTRQVWVSRLGGAGPKNDELLSIINKDTLDKFIISSMERLDVQVDKLNKEHDKYYVLVGKDAFTPDTFSKMFSKESETISSSVSTFVKSVLDKSSENELNTYLQTDFESEMDNTARRITSGSGGFSYKGITGNAGGSREDDIKNKEKLKTNIKDSYIKKDKESLKTLFEQAFTSQLAQSRNSEMGWDGGKIVPKTLRLYRQKSQNEMLKTELFNETIEYVSKPRIRQIFIGPKDLAPYATSDFQAELLALRTDLGELRTSMTKKIDESPLGGRITVQESKPFAAGKDATIFSITGKRSAIVFVTYYAKNNPATIASDVLLVAYQHPGYGGDENKPASSEVRRLSGPKPYTFAARIDSPHADISDTAYAATLSDKGQTMQIVVNVKRGNSKEEVYARAIIISLE